MILQPSKCPDVDLPMRVYAKTCKFCGADIMLRVNEDAFSMYRPEIWWSWAACNRCADFKIGMIKCRDELSSFGGRISATSTRSGMPPKSREVADAILRRAHRLCCDFYGIVMQYEVHLTDTFMDKPDKGWSIVKMLWTSMEGIAEATLKRPIVKLSGKA